MPSIAAGGFGLDIDLLDLGSLALGQVQDAAPGAFTIVTGLQVTRFTGSGFTFGANGFPTGGVISRVTESYLGQTVYDLSGLSTQAGVFFGWVAAGAGALAKATLLGGADTVSGSGLVDRLRGFGGDDTLTGGDGGDYLDGGEGDDDLFGGPGADTVVDSAGGNYLRGEDGDDLILGGAGFDDAHGNQGADTVAGGPGDDWVVGGRDNDVLFGDDGDDIVYGNLGDDTLEGGAGADLMRGGQGGDTLAGGAGADWMSGDRGDDTLSGGSGADTFHSFAEAGIDRVLDFSAAQGDRVQLALGSVYTVSQSGADTVIAIQGGAQLILAGVTATSLPAGTIFLA